MEVTMTRSKQQIRETETRELSETELNEVTGGIIAVLQQKSIIAVAPQRVLCDGSVKPA
jgi:bacteriocin-like protein